MPMMVNRLRYLAVSVGGWTDPVGGTSFATGWGLHLEGTPHGVSLLHGLNVKSIQFTFWWLIWLKHRAVLPALLLILTYRTYFMARMVPPAGFKPTLRRGFGVATPTIVLGRGYWLRYWRLPFSYTLTVLILCGQVQFLGDLVKFRPFNTMASNFDFTCLGYEID